MLSATASCFSLRCWRVAVCLVMGASMVMVPSAKGQERAHVEGANWFSDVDVGLQVEGGAMGNSGHPKNGANFGQLLPSYSGQPLLNQIALTVTKPVDDIGHGYGIGANIQVIYGSDARSYIISGISD